MKKNRESIFGIIAFIVLLLCLWFIGGPIQEKYELYGLLITEIIILALALIFALVFKISMKEMLPIKIPTPREVFGVIVIWFASLIISMTINIILMYFFPGMLEVTDILSDIITQKPMWIAIIVVAVMPAICEEAFHRGFLLSSFKAIKKDWVLILIMGVIFGIFHLDPYRFAVTGFLGAVLTYIMIKKRNIILPMIFHFINNLFSTIVSFQNVNIDVDVADTTELINLSVIITYLAFSLIAVFIFKGGNKLLVKEKKCKKNIKKQV